MIAKLLPLTKNKIEILSFIYKNKETHLLEIAKKMGLHPFSVQKTLKSMNGILKQKKAGKTILLSLNKEMNNFDELVLLLENYRRTSKNKHINSLIIQLTNFFSDESILMCILFGSYAREAFTEKSDIDILLIVKRKDNKIKKKISQLSSLLGKEISPLILTEKEFADAINKNEPSIMSLKDPSQRIIVKGAHLFLRYIREQ